MGEAVLCEMCGADGEHKDKKEAFSCVYKQSRESVLPDCLCPLSSSALPPDAAVESPPVMFLSWEPSGRSGCTPWGSEGGKKKKKKKHEAESHVKSRTWRSFLKTWESAAKLPSPPLHCCPLRPRRSLYAQKWWPASVVPDAGASGSPRCWWSPRLRPPWGGKTQKYCSCPDIFLSLLVRKAAHLKQFQIG